MPPDLPESYYLDNVKTLFTHVETVYSDFLEVDYVEFLTKFANLPEDSKKLYIRLLNRNSEWFRLSKLNYSEITSISLAIRSLQDSDFLLVDTELEIEKIITLFTKAELTKLHPDKKKLHKFGRQQINDYLLENNNDELFHRLLQKDSFLKVRHKDIYILFQMLFFGNLKQSMTDFVLRDLGLYQYENYIIDARHRPYSNSQEIEQHWLLHQLETLIESLESFDTQLLLDCFENPALHIHQQSFLNRKAERIKYKIARQIERMGQLDLALSLYQQCQLPPTRERCSRIYQQQGNTELAIAKCQEIIDAPFDDTESQFAIEFSTRLIKRYKLNPLSGQIVSANYQPDIVNLQLKQQKSVEKAVVEHHCSSNSHTCFYLENSLFNGVLGLLTWDAIFTPVPGAFYNPFQYRPSDYYAFDFVQKRQSIFDTVWDSIENNNDIWDLVSNRWAAKHGLMNPLVNWSTLDLDIIQLALQRIDYGHWIKIFNRILNNLRHNRAGFPDLILFPSEGGYKLIEVKGPGDKLQKNQQRWMSFFSKHDIPHELLHVSWV